MSISYLASQQTSVWIMFLSFWTFISSKLGGITFESDISERKWSRDGHLENRKEQKAEVLEVKN